MTSPIERLVDQACGVTEESRTALRQRWIARGILLVCPDCGASKRVHRIPVDPPSAVECVYPCPLHKRDAEVVYRDAAGAEVPL